MPKIETADIRFESKVRTSLIENLPQKEEKILFTTLQPNVATGSENSRANSQAGHINHLLQNMRDLNTSITTSI